MGLLLVLAISVSAQDRPPPLQAEVMMGTSDKMRKVQVYSISGRSMLLSLEGVDREARIPLEQIRKISFFLGPTVESGIDLVRQSKYVEAEDKLRGPVFRLMPYLAIEDHNLSEMLEAYELALQQLGDAELLRRFYRERMAMQSGDEAKTAKAWLAFLDARDGLWKEVEAVFNARDTLKAVGEMALLGRLSLCRLELSRKSYQNAIDYAAWVVAVGAVSDPLYSEAMSLSAACYEGLAAEELALLATERKGFIKKEMLSERIKVARELEKAADEQGAPSPTEKQIVEAIDREAVEKRIPALPELQEIGHHEKAQRLYLFIERVFPDTRWATEASVKIIPESREGSRPQLVMQPAEEKAPAEKQGAADGKKGKKSNKRKRR